jgi:hypothetical protein
VDLTVTQYEEPSAVASAVLTRTGRVCLNEVPGLWEGIWNGMSGRAAGPRAPARRPTRGLKAKLLDVADDLYPGASSLRYATVAGFLSDLEDKGFLDATEAGTGGRGRPPKAWKLTGRDGEEVDVLPPVEVMFPEGGGNKMDKLPPAKPK